MIELILDVKKRGLPIILMSHNTPHAFEVADRIHIIAWADGSPSSTRRRRRCRTPSR